MSNTLHDRSWSLFRRAFLWTLAAFALLWSLRADAADQGVVVEGAAPAVSTEAPGSSITQFGGNWAVTILPNAPRGATVNGRTYEDVYASIPYRRAEYLANPGYRHEATMEILFGQLRPKTVVSNYTPQVVKTPVYSVYKPFRPSQTNLYRTWRPSPFGFGFPVSPYYPSYGSYPMLY
jgi:hypothetical protein